MLLYVVVSLDILFDRYGEFSPYIALPYENSQRTGHSPQPVRSDDQMICITKQYQNHC